MCKPMPAPQAKPSQEVVACLHMACARVGRRAPQGQGVEGLQRALYEPWSNLPIKRLHGESSGFLFKGYFASYKES